MSASARPASSGKPNRGSRDSAKSARVDCSNPSIKDTVATLRTQRPDLLGEYVSVRYNVDYHTISFHDDQTDKPYIESEVLTAPVYYTNDNGEEKKDEYIKYRLQITGGGEQSATHKMLSDDELPSSGSAWFKPTDGGNITENLFSGPTTGQWVHNNKIEISSNALKPGNVGHTLAQSGPCYTSKMGGVLYFTENPPTAQQEETVVSANARLDLGISAILS